MLGCAVPECHGISHPDLTFRETLLWDRVFTAAASLLPGNVDAFNQEDIMTNQTVDASRRDFVAAAVTVAAGGGVASGAQAKTPSTLRFSNPVGIENPVHLIK